MVLYGAPWDKTKRVFQGRSKQPWVKAWCDGECVAMVIPFSVLQDDMDEWEKVWKKHGCPGGKPVAKMLRWHRKDMVEAVRQLEKDIQKLARRT